MANIHQNGDDSASLWGLVLAGGDGKRLQSYIRATRDNDLPKQYVNFVGKQSLFERTCRRSELLIPAERIFTIVSRHHLRHDEVRRQLTERVNGTVIIQPENRETGPGLLLPLMHLYNRCSDAIVAVFPSDHFIVEEERFMDHVQLAARAVERDPSKIVLLAMEADKPEVEYGYIVPSQNDSQINPSGLRRAAKFVEKPDAKLAEQLVKQGALWNTMIMVFKVIKMMAKFYPKIADQFLCILNAIGTPRENQTIESIYRNIEPMSFSKGFLEKLSQTNPEILAVLPVLQVSWSDWGSPDRLMQSLALLKKSHRRPGADSSPAALRLPTGAVDAKPPFSWSVPSRLLHRALSIALCALSIGALVVSADRFSWAQNVISRDDASKVLTVENLQLENGGVTGIVQNRSPHLIRDVQLFVRHTWLWDNETKPGKNDPGTSAYFTLREEIPPGGRASFNYRPSQALSQMASGQYQSSVFIAGFTEVIPQAK
jgi:mannose-1-phosphate guanylyltransferase